MTSGVYEIVNTVNGKRYVGSAVDMERRRAWHFSALSRGAHHSSKLQNAHRKHGGGSFVFTPLLVCAKAMLLFYEQRALDALAPAYNIEKTAGSRLGHTASAETRAKMSAAATGKKKAPEAIAKTAAALRGRKRPPDVVARVAAARTAVGHHFSVAHRAKLSAAARARVVSDATRATLSAAQKGRTATPETIAKRMATRAANRANSTRKATTQNG